METYGNGCSFRGVALGVCVYVCPLSLTLGP